MKSPNQAVVRALRRTIWRQRKTDSRARARRPRPASVLFEFEHCVVPMSRIGVATDDATYRPFAERFAGAPHDLRVYRGAHPIHENERWREQKNVGERHELLVLERKPALPILLGVEADLSRAEDFRRSGVRSGPRPEGTQKRLGRLRAASGKAGSRTCGRACRPRAFLRGRPSRGPLAQVAWELWRTSPPRHDSGLTAYPSGSSPPVKVAARLSRRPPQVQSLISGMSSP
jgi:hypothetical protein